MRLQAFIKEARLSLGVERAYDIELLIEQVLGFSRAQQRFLDVAIAEEALSHLQGLIERVRQGEPVAYILGRQDFYDISLKINSSSLIPRPDTECLLQAALEKIPEDACWAVADLGTGSGALAVALGKHRPHCKVIALDKARESLDLAKENAALNGVGNVWFVQGDWLEALGDARFDVLLSNPPYIAENDPHLKALRYEPKRALVAEDNGFADLHHLLLKAGRVLKEEGFLLLEHGFEQGKALRDFAQQHDWQEVETLRDYGGNERVLCARKGFF